MQALSTHTQHCHHDCSAQRDVQRTWDRVRAGQDIQTTQMQRWILPPPVDIGP